MYPNFYFLGLLGPPRPLLLLLLLLLLHKPRPQSRLSQLVGQKKWPSPFIVRSGFSRRRWHCGKGGQKRAKWGRRRAADKPRNMALEGLQTYRADKRLEALASLKKTYNARFSISSHNSAWTILLCSVEAVVSTPPASASFISFPQRGRSKDDKLATNRRRTETWFSFTQVMVN